MQIKKRFIWLNILLCWVTLGIYSIYWFYTLTEDSNKISPEHATASGGKAVLLNIVTLGIYGYYWHYKLGIKTYKQFHSGTLELFLYIIGLGFINYILCQSEINKYADVQNRVPTKRSLPISILLSIVTFGIYGAYWQMSITEESNTVCPEIKLPNGDTCQTFSVISLGFYDLYWANKVAKRLQLNVALCVVFALLCPVVTLAVAQHKINAIAQQSQPESEAVAA